MGILDEAIRDHLELKRKGGAQETDLKRLEDEAFGPPSRPGDVAAAVATPAEAPEALKREPSPPGDAEEESDVPEPSQPESREAAPAEEGGEEPSAAPPRGGVFHDFAAEEGLVSPRGETPPAQEASLDDTQPHDVESELGAVEEPTPAPQKPPAESSDEFELAEEDLELEVEDEERPSGDLGGAEQNEELVVEEVDVEEVAEGDDEEGDDVLEETPDFLRETPEHDRLWFEQRPPKDFDFDE